MFLCPYIKTTNTGKFQLVNQFHHSKQIQRNIAPYSGCARWLCNLPKLIVQAFLWCNLLTTVLVTPDDHHFNFFYPKLNEKNQGIVKGVGVYWGYEGGRLRSRRPRPQDYAGPLLLAVRDYAGESIFLESLRKCKCGPTGTLHNSHPHHCPNPHP